MNSDDSRLVTPISNMAMASAITKAVREKSVLSLAKKMTKLSRAAAIAKAVIARERGGPPIFQRSSEYVPLYSAIVEEDGQHQLRRTRPLDEAE